MKIIAQRREEGTIMYWSKMLVLYENYVISLFVFFNLFYFFGCVGS